MIFHENRHSHEIPYLFFLKFRKMPQNLSSAAVVIDALRVTCKRPLFQMQIIINSLPAIDVNK